MSTWSRIYESKIISAEEAAKVVPSGSNLFLTGNCSVPQRLLKALVQRARADQVEGVRIHQVLTIGDAEYVSPDLEGKLRVNTMFISANVRKAGGLHTHFPARNPGPLSQGHRAPGRGLYPPVPAG